MVTVYVYILDTLADWELGHVISELKSGRFFKKDAQRIALKTVSCSNEPNLTSILIRCNRIIKRYILKIIFRTT